MNPRLLILFALAGGLAVFLAVKASSPKSAEVDDADFLQSVDGLDGPLNPITQVLLWRRDLPGEEPPEEPELDIQVEVDQVSGKNRLNFWISESHGYYVETFRIRFWYKETPEMTLMESLYDFEHYLDKYVQANETFKDCIEVVPAELANVGGGMGSSENWGAVIQHHGRWRAKNPDPLPPIVSMSRCE